ncbi:MAG: RNA 3'-terminal phosphate cyclase [Armatimonadota bacterium]|nr:RNA 3'-terminal phosphate cyclase [Armatimonadota bacterium]MCX7777928.1 RNA 3'-terminal phosphate cyclase [Armatimonadota bacterium]MDW8025639.1 RNA 3'-terminal phosphate cyclase [Armatimonadota bacterium]
MGKGSNATDGFVLIDGSYGEGGGQILRTSLALSALTQKPLRIEHIRAGRSRPGLRPQHLTGVKAVQMIANAEVEGAHVESTSLSFIPKGLRSGNFTFDVSEDRPSAGSITLIFQTVLPALMFAERESTLRIIRGGTHVPMSPPADYIQSVFLPMLERMGASASFEVKRAGWYPKGGGEALCKVTPVKSLSPIEVVERGSIRQITIVSAISNLKRSIAERQASQALRRLTELGIPKGSINVELAELPSVGQGTMLFLLAEFENVISGFSSLGEIGKPAEKVADEAAEEFASYLKSNAPVDGRLCDQIVLYMALANGRSCIRTERLTMHAHTNMWVIEHFLEVKFEVKGNIGEQATIRVDGVGVKTG